MLKNSDKPQIATVIFNKVTKQFFVTFNNYDAKEKGLSRPKNNFKWIKKRVAEIKAGTKSLERTPSILHVLDSGLMWAIAASNIDDWQEKRLKRRCELKDTAIIEKRIAYRMESKGFTNMRVLKTKGPDKTKWDSYQWGAWTPENKSLKQLYKLFDNLSLAMGKDIPVAMRNKAYYECTTRNTIKNKCDLWQFFKNEGLFSDE
jgi:hypothetical protein